MAFIRSAVLLGLLLYISVCTGEIVITGDETPLIVGLARDITCTWRGETNASKMEWFLVALDEFPIESAVNSNTVVLSPDPNSIGLDGAMFSCRVTIKGSAQKYNKTVELEVKELENTVIISTSPTTPMAGQPYTIICTVTSDRPPQVHWLNPSGDPVNGSGITPSSQVTNGLVSSVEITFFSLHTSHSGRYTCVSTITNPPSREQALHLLTVKIPPPSLLITREPQLPIKLFTTNSLILTCIIQVAPEVDTSVTISSRWTGHSSLSDNQRRVIISELGGLHPTYESSVTFSALKSSDSGSYVCSAKVSPMTNMSDEINESSWSTESLNISVSLNVTIEVTYKPPFDFTLPSPPYYRPATSVTLTCRTHGATGTLTYQWSSTCSSCFASSSTSQSVNDKILTSSDAGVHTCTVTDADGNKGTNSTEMQLIGGGIYVDESRYYDNTAVANNTVVVKKSSSCYFCKITYYCYSNSSSSSVGYIRVPTNSLLSSTSSWNYWEVYRQNPSGIRVRNYRYENPYYNGIHVCEIPDSNGNTLEIAIGIYSSTPSAPYIYGSGYTDFSTNNSNTTLNLLGTVICRTYYSPPTNVTWTRDGVTIPVDGDRYEMVQTVTDRSSSYYDNLLKIRDAVDLAGNHTYTCYISNYAGSTSKSISTNMTAEPLLNILSLTESIYLESYTLTCRATFIPKIVSQLIPYLVLEWVGPDGVALDAENSITIEEQQSLLSEATRSLTFHPLNMTHGGTYKCEARLLLSDLSSTFNSTSQFHLNVLNRTIIQLKFGPMIHCSKWFEDRRIATHLEQDLKQTLAGIINKNCNCGFQVSQIDEGEFSCQTCTSSVTYRARVTGSSDTLTPPELLAPLQDWLTNDGTFLYTYHGRIRLRADKHCPLEITSFSEPECGSGQELDVPPSPFCAKCDC